MKTLRITLTTSLFTLAFSIAALALLGSSRSSIASPPQVDGNDKSDHLTCSTRTLTGVYGIKFEGQTLNPANPGIFASVSRMTLDGQGHFTVSETGRFNGQLVQRTFSGSYVVNADCTGYLDYTTMLSNPPHPVHGDFVLVDKGDEFFVLDNEDNWVASGVGKKL